MILINLSSSANTAITTFSERLNLYGIDVTTGQTFYLKIVNDSTKEEYLQSAPCSSPYPHRYNQFDIGYDVEDLSFAYGQYTITAYADSGYTEQLEIGRLIYSGEPRNDIYY